MPTAHINGVDLYYEVHGRGFPVLLLHGYAGTTVMWRPQVPALSRRYRLILPDLRGHGNSEAPDDPSRYSPDLIVEDQYHLLRHLGVEQAVVGGLSLGGIVAMRFCLAHPEMTRALILADTGPGFRNPQRLAEWQRQCQERARILQEQGMEGFMASPYAVDDYYTPPEVMRTLNPIGLAHVSTQVMAQAQMVPVERIAVPTLILCGTRDTAFIPASRYLHQHIPNAILCMIPKAGHGANVDQPELFNALVLAWLEELGL